MIDPEEITHKIAISVFRDAFNRRVGVGRKLSYGDLSDKTGIQVRTLKSWHDGQAMPQLDNVLKLASVFGPDFVSEILGVIGQGGVEYVDLPDHSDAQEVMADMMDVVNEISQRLRDKVFCRNDKAAVWPMLMKVAHGIEEEAKAMKNEVSR